MSDSDSFVFPDIDEEGMATLEAITKADKFNKWMYDTISPYCKGKTLEIGSGIGNISQFFFNDKRQIILSDIRDNYCDILKEKFAAYQPEVLSMNLTDPEFETQFTPLKDSFDSIFALNVVEHIEDDSLALKNCHYLLKPGGHVVILVPAFQALYNNFDKNLEHFRRYNKKNLTRLINENYEVIHRQYFNLAGIPGWFVFGGLLRKDHIDGGPMGLYNKLVPIFKTADKIIFNQIGLSVICVGRKT